MTKAANILCVSASYPHAEVWLRQMQKAVGGEVNQTMLTLKHKDNLHFFRVILSMDDYHRSVAGFEFSKVMFAKDWHGDMKLRNMIKSRVRSQE